MAVPRQDVVVWWPTPPEHAQRRSDEPIGSPGDDGSGIPARPSHGAYALGMEYVLDGGSNAGIFYAEYLKPSFDAGYWDDADREPDYTDGSWIAPKEFGLVVLGADYAAQFRANATWPLKLGRIQVDNTSRVTGYHSYPIPIGGFYNLNGSQSAACPPASAVQSRGYELAFSSATQDPTPLTAVYEGTQVRFGDRALSG